MKNTKKILSTIIAVVILLALVPVGSFARIDATYSFEGYELTNAPSGMNITYYSDIYSRGFTWITTTTNTETLLYIVEGNQPNDFDFETKAQKVVGTCETKYDSEYKEDKVGVHHVSIENLTPGQTYTYKAGGNGDFVYGGFTVEESNSDSVTIINFTDPQTKDPTKLNYWENCVKTAFDNFGNEADFVMHNGDMYDDNMKFANGSGMSPYYKWAVNLDTLNKYKGEIPLVESTGNHEADSGNLWVTMNEVNFAGYSSSMTSGYYSFDYGNVHFVILAYISGVTTNQFIAEMEWLDADLKAASENDNIKWTVVATHWGPYTTGDHGSSGSEKNLTLTKELCGLCSKYHVDLVVQGHDHTYSKSTLYKWDEAGFTASSKNASKVLTLEPETIAVNGTTYMYNEKSGTYYVSCGSSGHRNDENASYSNPLNGTYFSASPVMRMGTTLYDTPYANAGDPATGTLCETSFGVLNINGDVLVYDFYVATENGEAVKIDSLNIYKGTEDDTVKATAIETSILAIDENTDDDTVVECYQEYASASSTVQALISDNAKDCIYAHIGNLVKKNINKDIDSKIKANQPSLVELQLSDGDMNSAIRMVASIPTNVISCGFDVVFLDKDTNEEKTISKKITEVYSSQVLANDELGFDVVFEDVLNSYYMALTITNIPNGNYDVQIKPYIFENKTDKIYGDIYQFELVNGNFVYSK